MLQYMKWDHRFLVKVVTIATYIHNQIPIKAIFRMTLKECSVDMNLL